MYRTLLVLCLLALAGMTQAQTLLGLKAGATLSNFTQEQDIFLSDVIPGVNFTGGVYAQTPLTNRLYLRPEINYTRYSFRSQIGDNMFLVPHEVHYRFDYLAVPLFVGIQAGSFGFDVGLQPGIRLASHASSSPGLTDLSFLFDNKVTLGYALGLHYTKDRWETQLSFYRETTAATNVFFTDENGEAISSTGPHLVGLQLTLNYLLGPSE